MLRIFFGASIIFSSLSCSNARLESKGRGSSSRGASCVAASQASKHAAISTRMSASRFSGCFLNYLKLHKTDSVHVELCSYMTVQADGAVSRARVVSAKGDLSNDLKWCIEQALWKMDYSGLQFQSTKNLQFPLSFKVRK